MVKSGCVSLPNVFCRSSNNVSLPNPFTSPNLNRPFTESMKLSIILPILVSLNLVITFEKEVRTF